MIFDVIFELLLNGMRASSLGDKMNIINNEN